MSRCWNAANSLACRDAAAVGAAIGGAPSHELGAETRAKQLGCDGEDDVAIVSACIASAGSLQRAFELIRSESFVVKEEPVDDGGRMSLRKIRIIGVDSRPGRRCDIFHCRN